MALNVSIVSAEAALWTGEATQVVARTVEGEIGILTGHEPVLAILAPGEVRVTAADGSTVTAEAGEGFLSVDRDQVLVVSGAARLV